MLRKQIREAREQGFTLIELLIVIVVLGILAGIVVFGVGTFRADSKTAACDATLKTISVAADAYNAKFGAYTGPNAAGTALASPATALTVGDLVTLKYVKAAPPASMFSAGPSISAAGDVTGTCAA